MLRLRLAQAMKRAEVAELADARDSKSRGPCGHEGSTPSFGTHSIILTVFAF